MKVTVRTTAAALLVGRAGFQVYLRAVGPHAAHPVGHVGAQLPLLACRQWRGARDRAAAERYKET